MTHDDFRLTDDQLAKINDHLRVCAERHAREKEDAAGSVSITFDYVVNHGRCISVRYDGQITPTVVVDFGN